MTHMLVRPAYIGFGDTVRIEGHEYLVTSIDGPDTHGTYDLYLLDKGGNPHHKVVAESIELTYEQP